MFGKNALNSSLNIYGIQQAQRENLRWLALLRPDGLLGQAAKVMLAAAQKYAVNITHVDTGALKSSEQVYLVGNRGMVFLDPNAVGPHGKPSYYGPYEHNRGGEHAFFDRTVEEAGEQIIELGQRVILRGLT